jgi:hypothetical protein
MKMLINYRMAMVLAWWFISAHKWFKGPVINVEHHMLGRDEVVHGVEGTSDSDTPSIPDKAAEAESTQTAELK